MSYTISEEKALRYLELEKANLVRGHEEKDCRMHMVHPLLYIAGASAV